MKKLDQKSWLLSDILRAALAQTKTGVNYWLATLRIPCDVLCWLQYSQVWIREQYHETNSSVWRKDLEQ